MAIFPSFAFASIRTKYLGPTSTLGARVVAQSANGHRLIRPWDDAASVEENHFRVADELILKLKWAGTWVPGAEQSGYVFVRLG